MATAKQSTSIDDDFQSFLDEVEQLSIRHSEPEAGVETNTPVEASAAACRGADGINADKQTTTHVRSNNSRANVKRDMIANANDKQRAWSDFKKLDLSSVNSRDDELKNKSDKVSFQISSAKDKKKKKKKSNTVDINGKQDIDEGGQPRGGKRSDECPGASSGARNAGSELFDGVPRWTLIIDTCSLLEDRGTDVQSLIGLANNASLARANVHNNSQSLAALACTIVDEPIDVVVPFRVWSELEHRSKSDDDEVAYAARKAIRMLRDELAASSKGGTAANVDAPPALRSQSLLESNEAADRYIRDTQATNDDHILACAMAESEKCRGGSSMKGAGGVVLVTLDNNLACKAYANGLRVDSPSKFRDYYHKRMSSLRERAKDMLVDSALRK